MTPQLLPTATPQQSRRAVRDAVRPHRLLAVAATITLVGGSVAALLVPPIIGHIVDLVRDGRGPGAITAPIVLLAALALVQAVLTSWGQLLVAQLGETSLATLRERVVERALRLPVDRVERAGSGDLVARVSGDVSVIATAARTVLPALAGAGLTVALTLVGLAVLDWRLALAALVAAPVQLYTVHWYLGRAPHIFAQERIAEGSRTQQLLDSVGGASTVRAYRLGRAHIDAVRARSADAVGVSLQTNRILTRFFGRLNLAEVVGLGAVLATGYWLVGAGTVSVGSAAAAALYFHRLFDPINTLLALIDDLQEATAGLARLVGILDIPRPVAPAHPHAPVDTSVTVADVDFGYVAGHPVLHDVSLRVGAGEHVALVGVSGAGKTTLAKLVAGLADPTDGTVRLGGVALHELADLRRHVALVTQEVHVFTGSVADDLRLAASDADDAALRGALEVVGAQRWVDALPDGLHTRVGEGGASLTAAQGQQLALARLVLADPPVAVLDEATADAGSAGARQLERAAEAALRGRTALVVAHRLSQAAGADRIVVLDDGRVVESGSHPQLSVGDGPYARLWRAWAGSRLADAAHE